MQNIKIRKIKKIDKKYFAKWWRDKDLARLTSGITTIINDEELDKYFLNILELKKNYHFIITLNNKAIGHISLVERKTWYETQIIIGNKEHWGKGYGTEAIKLIIKYAKKLKISKIYLEVRANNLRAIKAYKKCGFIKKRIIKYPKNKYLFQTIRMELK